MNRTDRIFASVLVLALLITGSAVVFSPAPSRTVGVSGQLGSFSSYDQVLSSIAKSGQNQGVNGWRQVFNSFAPDAALAVTAGASSAASFTTTNIQVQGVDEPDIVKTDGTYVYVASWKTVSIILASPDKAEIVQTLDFDGQVNGLLLSPGRLVVIETGQVNASRSGWIQTANLFLYDVSDVSAPALVRLVSMNGTYVDARLSAGFVYAIFQQPTQVWMDGNYTAVPAGYRDGKSVQKIPATSVFYSKSSLIPFSMYTIIMSMSVADGSHSQNALLTGWGSTVYASNSNVYLAFPDRMAYPIYFGMAAGIRVPAGAPALLPFWWGGWGTNTTIYRVAYSNGSTNVESQGTVPGTILNQFSLDEHDGYLRVATTSNSMLPNQTWARVNNVYVLDQGMSVVGSVEGLAPNENIYSVRFVGDLGYVVTYNRIDPLFAISLSDPRHPAVLNALELTGFSDYLHPLGNGYLLGVGKQTIPAENEAGYVIFQGVKLSLFHVASDGSSTEVTRYLVGDRGSDSSVSYDHKAFLYDPRTGLVALPILVAQLNGSSGAEPWATGYPVWQGAYLFNFSVSGGFHLVGRVTQIPGGMTVQEAGDFYVNRVFVIGGHLYTLSNRLLMVTDLSTLDTVAKVKIP